MELPNSLDFLIIYLACIFGRITIIPINPNLPEEEKKYIKQVTKPKITIGSEFNLLDINQVTQENILVDKDFNFGIFFTSGTTNLPKGICHNISTLLYNAKIFNEHVGINQDVRMLHIMPMGYMAGFLNAILSPLLAGGCIIIGNQFNVKQAMTFWDFPMSVDVNTMWLSPTMVALLTRLNRSKEISEWTKANLKNVFVGTAPFSAPVREVLKNVFC